MALFVINRFLDEADVKDASEDRSKALLDKLCQRAKARQLEKQNASVIGQKEDPVSKSTSLSKSKVRKEAQSLGSTPIATKKTKQVAEEDEEPHALKQSELSGHSQTKKKEGKRKSSKRGPALAENDEPGKDEAVARKTKSQPEEEDLLGREKKETKKRRMKELQVMEDEEGRADEVKKKRRKRKSEHGEEGKAGREDEVTITKEGADSIAEEEGEPGKENSVEEELLGREKKGRKKRRQKESQVMEGDEEGRTDEVKKKIRKRKSQHVEEGEAGREDEETITKEDVDSIAEEEGEPGKENSEEIDLDTDNSSGSLDESEEEVVAETDPETSSLVLGGFKKKAFQKVQRVLPHWLSHPSLIQKDIKQHLVPIHDVPGIHPKLLKKLQANQIQSFFPVQAEVIPAIMESTCHGLLVGRGGYRPSDICVSAPTGSGKTLAFVVPVIQALLERVACHVRALVVLPTKELAQQVCKVFSIYADGTSLKIVLVTGQKSFAKEQETLVEKTVMGYRSLADIVVATPGRLVDHIEQTPGFSLKQLRFLIIDEADRMIDSMSQDWLHRVTKAVYRHEEGDDPSSLFTRKEPGPITAASTCFPQMPLQKLLFSATLTQNPEKLQQLGLYLPRLFSSRYDKNADSTETGDDSEMNYTLPEGLSQFYLPCNLNLKPLILLHLLVTMKFTRVLCFTNSRQASHRLFLLLRAFGGVSVAEFSSLLSPGERRKTLKEFEQEKIQILISTDATSRGIDIKGVRCVINYDAPQFIRVYIHRVGRTARAGKSGLAFTMLLNVQEASFLKMMRNAGISELQRQTVKREHLKPSLVGRYEEALSELQRIVLDERAKKRV
ncbi:ATP-dependent RNA helicase DDX51 [Ambystoma mexicanum]|uniref:ATP-dependent RNA helicase DDX51 n=1 Tax=Ambystoma mexicanum TaxID=8296 RepID=UPI0037E74E94